MYACKQQDLFTVCIRCFSLAFYLLSYTVLEGNSTRRVSCGRRTSLFKPRSPLFHGPIYGETREREYAVNFYARFFYGRARARKKAHLATMLQITDRKHKYRTFKSRSPEYASLLLRRQVQLLWGRERRLQFRVLFYATNLVFEELNSV